MTFDVTSNADEVATGLDGRIVDAAVEQANRDAADLAFALVNPRTPRRSGRLAAGLRVVVADEGWALVDPVPYATIVDARTGFATRTVIENEQKILTPYETQLQAAFDST